MMTNSRLSIELKATGLIAIASIMYGILGFAGTKVLQQHIALTAMLFWRFFIAAIYMIIMNPFRWHNSANQAPGWRTYGITFLTGSLLYGGGAACYFMASHYIGTGMAMVIFFAYPIFLVAYEKLFLKHHITKMTIVALIAIIVGLYLLTDGKKVAFNPYILLLAILAGLCYAAYFLVSKRIGNKMNDISLTVLVCLGCASMFLLLALVQHEFVVPRSLGNWIYLLIIGLICTAIPIQFTLIGLRHMSASKVAIITALEPITTVITGMIFLNEQLTLLQTVGVIAVLFSVVCIQFVKNKQPQKLSRQTTLVAASIDDNCLH